MNLSIETDSEGKRFELRPWHCPICLKSKERFIGFRGGKYQRYKQGIVNRIVQCESCKLLYPNPFPVPLDAQELYGDPEKYFTYHDEAQKVEDCRRVLRSMSVKLGRSKFRLLDIGSGRGELLHAAQLEGIDATGLEFSQAMIDYVQAKYGLTLLAQSVEDLAENSRERFDGFILNAVLEHVYDPDSMIATISKLASKNAVIYIDVPNEPNAVTRVGNAINRLSGNPAVYNLSPSWSPYHVYGFNRFAMQKLLSKYGFGIMELRATSTYSIPSRGGFKDRFKALGASGIMRLGNLIGSGTNMFLWAQKL